MLRTLRAAHERWPLARPFRISRGVKTAAEVVAVEIADGAAVGRGESVPYARYGETVESVLAQVRSLEAEIAAGLDRQALLTRLPAGAARNALDCALWDLEARMGAGSVEARTGISVAEGVVTALTVSLDTPEAMAAAARELAGAPLVKVKVDADRPAEKIRAVAENAPGARLIVDPNEGWSFDLLQALQPLLAELKVALVEQPLPAAEDGLLEGFRPSVPICADESAHTAADLGGLRGRYQAVNIKLDKTGGLTEALEMLRAARAMDFLVMTGCMVSTSLGVAPALPLAARSDFADLDGPVWMAQDRPGGVRVEAGRLLPPAPGFWGDPEPHNGGL
jgi:L-alanine-DL-glutamate epimerase-like enolase superfamily enzyme